MKRKIPVRLILTGSFIVSAILTFTAYNIGGTKAIWIVAVIIWGIAAIMLIRR